MKKKKTKFVLKSKYIITVLTVFCLSMIFLTFSTDMTAGPLKTVSGFVIMPLQKGINQVGSWLTSNKNYFQRQGDLVSQNKELEAQVNKLTDENNQLLSEKSELEELRKLYNIDETYIQLGEKEVAKVTSYGPDNWFGTFTIDKGSKHGIQKDANVISASGGLVGIVTEVGPNYATVRPIIDDVSTVSSSANTINLLKNPCYISGDLSLKDEGKLRIFKLDDQSDEVVIGSKVMTSNTSTKYLPGILIGTIDTIEKDPNNVTKSGTVIPAVDFKRLDTVLVIKKLKQIGDSDVLENSETGDEQQEQSDETEMISEPDSKAETSQDIEEPIND